MYPNRFGYKPVLELKRLFAFRVFFLRNCLSNDAYDVPHKELVASCSLCAVGGVRFIYKDNVLGGKAVARISFIFIWDHLVAYSLECKCLLQYRLAQLFCPNQSAIGLYFIHYFYELSARHIIGGFGGRPFCNSIRSCIICLGNG